MATFPNLTSIDLKVVGPLITCVILVIYKCFLSLHRFYLLLCVRVVDRMEIVQKKTTFRQMVCRETGQISLVKKYNLNSNILTQRFPSTFSSASHFPVKKTRKGSKNCCTGDLRCDEVDRKYLPGRNPWPDTSCCQCNNQSHLMLQ